MPAGSGQHDKMQESVNGHKHINSDDFGRRIALCCTSEFGRLGISVPLPHTIQEGLYLSVWREDITAINIELNQKEKG
jgi:hypothetical protein